MGQSIYKVLLQFIGQDKTSGAAKGASKSLDGLASSLKSAILGYVSLRGAQEALKFVKLGAEVSRASDSFGKLATAAGTSGSAILSAMNTASRGTIDNMTAMQIANRAMIMDVAETPAQFERLTKVAVTLGQAMGKDAASSIDDFVTAAGRQSKLIADNLGLIVNAEEAYEKYAVTLGKATDELTDAEKKQAFLNEMLLQGEGKMSALGSTTRDAAGDWEALYAQINNLKNLLAQNAGDALRVGALADGLSASAEAANLLAKASKESGHGIEGNTRAAAAQLSVVHDAIISSRTWQKDEEELRATLEEGNRTLWDREAAVLDVNTAESRLFFSISDVDVALVTTRGSMLNYTDALLQSEEAMDQAAGVGGTRMIDFLKEIDAKALEARGAMLDFSASYTDFIRDQKATSADLAKSAEDLEAEHQDKLNEIRKKGQSYAVKIDETAEWEKLEHLEDRLAQALQAQSEYTDKTKLSTRMAKEHSIEDLQGQLATQTKLLDDYNGGRLIKQGQNITSLLSAEDARYQEELRMLEASRIEQEAEQQRSLGQMLLNHWEAWATANNIGANEMMNMRLKISQEYGLITDAGYNAAQKQIDAWNIQYGVADSFFEMVMRRYNALPSEKVIRIRYEMSTPQVADPDRLGGEVMQHGGISSGRSTWVGERGPELVRLPPGSRVNSAAQSRSITNNYNLSLGTSARSAGIMADFATMRVMGG